MLLLSSLAATTALAAAIDDSLSAKSGSYQSDSLSSSSSSSSSSKPGTKDAPVDGADGRPHEGPFVDVESLRSSSGSDLKKDLPVLEGRPKDPTVIDGVKIPETNDGVMNDPNRAEPKQGTTGTSGGVSEKDQVRKAKEGATGEKVENKPEAPKEHPPLPHSEQEKISKDDTKSDKSKLDAWSGDDVSGLEVSRPSPSTCTARGKTVLTLRSRNPWAFLKRRPTKPFPSQTLQTRTTLTSRKGKLPARRASLHLRTLMDSSSLSTPSSCP